MSLINQSKVRAYALDVATAKRPHLCMTRVSAEYLDRVEARLRAMIREDIERLPSKGRTIK